MQGCLRDGAMFCKLLSVGISVPWLRSAKGIKLFGTVFKAKEPACYIPNLSQGFRDCIKCLTIRLIIV